MSTEVSTQHNSAMEVTIHTSAGDVKLNPSIVRKYLVNGNGAVTDQEIALFLGLCKAQNLNPFTREAYLIKYGGNQPAAIVVAKDVFLKRAYRSEQFKGHKAGIICQAPGSHDLTYTPGICPPGSKIVGGWAEVHTDGWSFPLRVEVDFAEYQARKSDGTPNRMWSEKPATMIRKVALVQALREAFPDNYQGMYSEEEIPTQEDLPRNPVDTAQVIDVPSVSAVDQVKVDGSEHPPSSNGTTTDRRRRASKQRVDPLIFGSDEIMTCGATAEQLTQLHFLAKSSAEVKRWITTRAKELTGYDQLSFLRGGEAQHILDEANRMCEQATEKTQSESKSPLPESVIAEESNQEELIYCPLNGGGDRVYLSSCLNDCRERKQMGWCPAIPGDKAPDMGNAGDMI